MLKSPSMHQPVLAQEILALFAPCHLKQFIDGTVGAGGHSLLLLSAHPELEKLYAFDQDTSALELAKKNLAPFGDRVEFIHSPFGSLADFVPACDGILFDIGVSSMQLDQAERGFSFYRDGPLDMRMNREAKQDAKAIVNHYPEKRLGELFREYGEERRWRQAAAAICKARRQASIETTGQLVKVLEPVLGWSKHQHPATRVFQALRIEVNQELEQLKEGIDAALSCLRVGGRLAIITFHSLEDRLVKHRFKEDKTVHILTKKPLVATREEQRINKRARSAKLRCVEKILAIQ